MAEREEELKNLLMRVKEKSEKASLKLNINKTKITTSSPITSWPIEREKVEAGQISSYWTLKSLWMVTTAMELENDCFLARKLWQIWTMC